MTGNLIFGTTAFKTPGFLKSPSDNWDSASNIRPSQVPGTIPPETRQSWDLQPVVKSLWRMEEVNPSLCCLMLPPGHLINTGVLRDHS